MNGLVIPLLLTQPVTAVGVAPGADVVLRGVVELAHDGTIVDATTERRGDGAPIPGGLYDVEAGGFRIVARDVQRHEYRLVATGREGSACIEARVSSPCLPLRLLPLAQARLLSVAEIAPGLSGGVSMEIAHASVPPVVRQMGSTLGWLGSGVATLFAGLLGLRRVTRMLGAPSRQARRRLAALRRRSAGHPAWTAVVASLQGVLDGASDPTRALAAITDVERRFDEHERERGVANDARLRAGLDERVATTIEALDESEAVIEPS